MHNKIPAVSLSDTAGTARFLRAQIHGKTVDARLSVNRKCTDVLKHENKPVNLFAGMVMAAVPFFVT